MRLHLCGVERAQSEVDIAVAQEHRPGIRAKHDGASGTDRSAGWLSRPFVHMNFRNGVDRCPPHGPVHRERLSAMIRYISQHPSSLLFFLTFLLYILGARFLGFKTFGRKRPIFILCIRRISGKEPFALPLACAVCVSELCD